MCIKRNIITFLAINNESDLGECRRISSGLATSMGFNENEVEGIKLVATELVSNTISYGGGIGYFIICRVVDSVRNVGLELWTIDNGVGIQNPKLAQKDGFSTGTSLGLGIGAIQRLSDDTTFHFTEIPVDLKNDLPFLDMNMNAIRSCFWLRAQNLIGINRNIEIGVASRPKIGEVHNGDSFLIHSISRKKVLTAVIDGLGHGKEAWKVSQLAKKQILSRPNLPLDHIIEKTHHALKGSRGATVGIASIDLEDQKACFVGFGNIEARVVTPKEKLAFLSIGGIVGLSTRTPKIYEHEFRYQFLLVLFSDGIRSSWQTGYCNFDKHPNQIAMEILNQYSKQEDDATIIIIKNNDKSFRIEE